MKTLEEQLSFYQHYHSKKFTKLTHYIGVPALIFAIFMFFLLLMPIWCVFALVTALCSYYIYLNLIIGGLTTIFLLSFFGISTWFFINYSISMINLIAFGLLAIGIILQYLGHQHEGKRPAFMDNAFQIFIAPIFLVAELFFTSMKI